MLAWVVILLVAVLVWAWQSTRRPSWSPQGPPLVPWIGNLLSINQEKPHESYAKWAEEYGGIYHVKFGAYQQIILSEPDLIREAFSRPELAGRPKSEAFDFLTNGTGIVASSGQLSQESRRFTLHHLRNLGMGKSHLEEFMHSQVTNFMDQILTPKCGQAIEVDQSLNVAIVNIIWKLVASEELGLTDTKVITTLNELMDLIKLTGNLFLSDAFPWLEPVITKVVWNKQKAEKDFKAVLENVFIPSIQQHREDLSLSGEPRDYIEAALREQQKRPELLTDWHLINSLVDLFIAGNDTTATTLRWVLCCLCNRPETQRRLQAELDREVGRQRLPSLADRPRLPYTEAVLLEAQRIGDIAPISVPHATLAPVTVGGYRLPAGQEVIMNLHSVHQNPQLFPEPRQFRPERFLDADGKFKPSKNVMAFSTGKRVCIGEGMARAELFLFLTCFMQKFTFRWPDGFKHDLSDNGKGEVIRTPAPYKLIPEKRAE